MKSKIIIAGIMMIGLLLLANCKSDVNESEKEPEAKAVAVSQKPGAQLFDLKCGLCHDGTMATAPQTSSLKKMPKAAILGALKTGVMRVQGSAISDKEHQQIADYLTQFQDQEAKRTVEIGKCESSQEEDLAYTKSSIADWGMGKENRRFIDSKNISINASNVGQLKLSWVFAFPDASRARVQPTIAGNTLFTASQHGVIYALDRATGCIRWTFQADAEVRSALTIEMDENNRAHRLYFSDFNATVYALDLTTKQLLWKKKVDDHPVATITGSLSLFENRLYIPVSSREVITAVDTSYVCCTFRGSVVSLNANDGALIWKTHTISEPLKQYGVTKNGLPRYAPSGAPVWSKPTIDAKRKLIYIGTGENYTRPATKTSDAIMAMSMEDGEIQWVNQTIPKDAWNAACGYPGHPNCPENNGPDADFGAPPMLINLADKDLIIAGQKSGFVYALDPDNGGTMVWKHLVGRGGIMGGVHWGMACDGQTVFVPINDHGGYPIHQEKEPSPGVHALDVKTGKALWSTIEKNRCPETKWSCGPGITAALTASSELVFAGALDGMLKAYHAKTGKELWAFDTQRTYEAVNGIEGYGGSIDSDGPVLVENQLFITTGYARFNEKSGNVLLAFEVN